MRNSQPSRFLAFLGWDAMNNKSRPLRLLCHASTDDLGATLVQKQPAGFIRRIVYIRRATLRQRTKLDSYSPRSGMRRVDIRHLRCCLFSDFFLICANHECLQQMKKIGESKPRIQRWMEFLSDSNYRLSYRRGREKANANFLSRLPSPLSWKTSRAHPLCRTLTTLAPT